MAVGHSPAASLAPQDEALFRAFQSNLLSLISHELRTPLTGVLNALGVLEEQQGASSDSTVGALSNADLITMARQNAQRLNRALVALLDVAAIESGTFHARFREVELARLVKSRTDIYRSLMKDQGIKSQISGTIGEGIAPVLADPQKIGRAIDLCLQVLVPRTEKGSTVQIRISSASRVEFEFTLAKGMEAQWDEAWSQAEVGYQGGVASPSSAFAASFGGVLQSEQAFLSRSEEGLGSEFPLVHEIIRIHRGKFLCERKTNGVSSFAKLILELPKLASESGLRAVLESRAYEIASELRSVALVLVQVPSSVKSESLAQEIKLGLFRTSDAVYLLPERQQIALVLDDCKADDAEHLAERILGSKRELSFGVAHCPADGQDPGKLFEIALDRLNRKIGKSPK